MYHRVAGLCEMGLGRKKEKKKKQFFKKGAHFQKISGIEKNTWSSNVFHVPCVFVNLIGVVAQIISLKVISMG